MVAQDNIRKEFKKFLREHEAKFEKESNGNHFLITGMPRLSGKTYTVLKFLIPRNMRILYVCRTVGKEDKKGTAYATKETIIDIQKKERISPRRILIIAGREKICRRVRERLDEIRRELESKGLSKEEIKEKEEGIRVGVLRLACEGCSVSKEIPQELENELINIQTMDIEKCEELSEGYNVCPKKIIERFEELADIHLITYSMLKYREIEDERYDTIVWDEARHLFNFNVYEKKLASYKNKKSTEQPFYLIHSKSVETIWSKIMPLPKLLIDDKVSEKEIIFTSPDYLPRWWGSIDRYAQIFLDIIDNLLFAILFKRYHISKSLDKEKRYEKIKEEYIEEMIQRELTEFNGQTMQRRNLQSLIENIEEDRINELLRWVIGWYKRHQDEPKTQRIKDEIIKTIEFLVTLYQIAGKDLRVEIREEEGEENIYLVAYGEKRLPRANLNIYIDATPYPIDDDFYKKENETYSRWLNIDSEDINYVILPPRKINNTEIVIVYENAQKTYTQVYGYGDNSEQFKYHIDLIKKLKEEFEKKGKIVAIAARNNDVRDKLGSNGISTDIVCRDVQSEGRTLGDADVIILEGTPRVNIYAMHSKMYDFGRMLNSDDPEKALQYIQSINTAQEMIQTTFRIVKEGQRSIIVTLGNKMREKFAWIDFGKNLFSWLNDSDIIHFVKIDGNQKITNKVKEIVEVANPDYNFSLTPLQNIIVRKLKELKNIYPEGLYTVEIEKILREEEGIEKSVNDIRKELNIVPDDIVEKIKVTATKTKYRYKS